MSTHASHIPGVSPFAPAHAGRERGGVSCLLNLTQWWRGNWWRPLPPAVPSASAWSRDS